MKVVFITAASDVRRKVFYRLGNRLYGTKNPITGPLILGHILKEAGHSVTVYEELYKDLNFRDVADADVICISFMTSSATRAYHLSDMFREKGIRVILGGIHASALPEEAALHADQVIVGEGESVILDVVEGKITDKIVYAESVMDLDAIPFPDYSLLKTSYNSANLISTRGCPFSCSFCTTSRMFAPYRERSVESVIEELKLYKRMGFKYVNFQDDNFTANKKRAKQILQKMIENDLIFKDVFFFGRTDLGRDEELLELLKKTHLTSVLVGVESLNQESLNGVNKQQNVEDIEACGVSLKRHKIKLVASLVLGLDDDSREDIRKAVQFCKQIEAYHIQPAILTPFPKTPVFEKMRRERRMLGKDWENFDMMSVTFQPLKMKASELQNEFFDAVKESYNLEYSLKILDNFGVGAWIRWLALLPVIRFGTMYYKAMMVRDREHRVHNRPRYKKRFSV